MQKATLLLICLACLGHSRRLQSLPPSTKRNSKGTNSTLQSVARVLLGFNPAARPLDADGRAGTLAPEINPKTVSLQPALCYRQRCARLQISMMAQNPQWLSEQILDVRQRVLDEEDPGILTAKTELAAKKRESGELEEAKDLLEEVVEIKEDGDLSGGEETLEALELKNQLGLVLYDLEDLGEAEILQREVLSDAEEAFESFSEFYNSLQPEVAKKYEPINLRMMGNSLAAKHNLAKTLLGSGDRQDLLEAERLQAEALEGRLSLSGPEDPDVIESKQVLAEILTEVGEKTELAEKMEKQADAARMRLSYSWTGRDDADIPEIKSWIDWDKEQKADTGEKVKTKPSHLQLDFEDDETPTQLRFAYVDEVECVGCTFCADVAPNTFWMEENAGRARAFHQGGDDGETIDEAINCCPVNCIWWVDLDDLIILETERDLKYGNLDQAMIGMRGVGDGFKKDENRGTQAKISQGGMATCSNCPSRGCKKCPMFGVGLNPAFKEKQDARKARSEEKKKKAQEKEVDEKQVKLNAFFDLLDKQVETKA